MKDALTEEPEFGPADSQVKQSKEVKVRFPLGVYRLLADEAHELGMTPSQASVYFLTRLLCDIRDAKRDALNRTDPKREK